MHISLLVLSGLLLGARSLEIEGVGTALEVDVVEDDAIFDLRPEGSSRRAIVA